MRKLAGTGKRATLVAGFAAALLLGGCGSGVHLEGPGFEALGLSGDKKKAEAKVPDRAPLLMPPDQARLPEPQQAQPTAVAAQPNWPSDPDVLRKSEVEEVAAKKSEYEDKGDWSGKGGAREFEKLSDPLERKSNGLLDKAIKQAR